MWAQSTDDRRSAGRMLVGGLVLVILAQVGQSQDARVSGKPDQAATPLVEPSL